MGIVTSKLREVFNGVGETLKFLYGPPDVDPDKRLPRPLAYPLTALVLAALAAPVAIEPMMLLALPITIPLTKPLSAVMQVAINTVTADIEEKLGFRNDFNTPAQRPVPKRNQPRPGRDFTIRF